MILFYPINYYKKELSISDYNLYEEMVNRISVPDTDLNVFSNIPDEYLFVRKTYANGIVLPIQKKHYSSRNSLMPVFSYRLDESGDESNITLTAISYFSVYSHIFLTVCFLLVLYAGLMRRAFLIFIIGELITQLFYWIPFKKAYKELTDLMRYVNEGYLDPKSILSCSNVSSTTIIYSSKLSTEECLKRIDMIKKHRIPDFEVSIRDGKLYIISSHDSYKQMAVKGNWPMIYEVQLKSESDHTDIKVSCGLKHEKEFDYRQLEKESGMPFFIKDYTDEFFSALFEVE